jgi:predicted DNA-binding transcriptional regulator AlpA
MSRVKKTTYIQNSSLPRPSTKPRKPYPKNRKKKVIVLTLPAEGFAKQHAVCHTFGISPSTLWRWINERKFPGPVKLKRGGRAIGWPVAALGTLKSRNTTKIGDHRGLNFIANCGVIPDSLT